MAPEITSYRLDDHSRRIGALETAVHDLERSLAALHGRLDEMKNQMVGMNAGLERAEREMQNRLDRFERGYREQMQEVKDGQGKITAGLVGLAGSLLITMVGLFASFAFGLLGGG